MNVMNVKNVKGGWGRWTEVQSPMSNVQSRRGARVRSIHARRPIHFTFEILGFERVVRRRHKNYDNYDNLNYRGSGPKNPDAAWGGHVAYNRMGF